MAGNPENQYGAASSEANPAGVGSWGAAPPIMHSWCLQPDGPSVQSESKSRLANDADDDCGFDLNLGLSLGGGKSSKAKSKEKEKEKEVILDRDTFREKDSYSKESSAPVEAPRGGVMFKALKTEQGAGNPRVQSFWQDLDVSGNEAKEKAVAFPPRQAQSPISHPEHNTQPVEGSNWAGGNSVAEDSKMFAQHMWQALQGKAAQPEHQRVPLSARDEASLIKELQGLPPQAVATAAAWARVVAQGGFPVQLLEAIKDGVDPQGVTLQRSKSLHSEAAVPMATSPAMSTGPSGDVERSDSDVSKNMQFDQRQVAITQQQELMEQQRKREVQTQKRQELRRKRKALLEGQKSKKTSKKEEERAKSGSLDSPPNPLRRTSSLQPLPVASKENSLSTVSSPPDSQDATGGASSLSAFRRPGSSSWLHNWEGSPQIAAAKADAEKTQHGAAAAEGRGDPGEQMVDIRHALERARDRRGSKDRGDVDSNAQVDSSSESRKVGSPDVVQMQRMDLESGARQGTGVRHESSGLGPPPVGQIDPAWIQKIMEMQMSSHQLTAMMENNRELAAKSGFPPLPRRGSDNDNNNNTHPPAKAAKRRRGASESSSGGTESSGGHDEKTGRVAHDDAEALSSPAAGNGTSAGGDAGRPNAGNNSAAMPPLGNAVAMANMAFPPGGGFPMMPGPFPFPLPMPPGGAAGSVPFSMPFPFPYVMQFAPSPGNAADGSNPEQQRAHPAMASPFQITLPAGFNPPFQIQTPEGAAAWASAVVRPHAATPPQSPPRNGAAAKPGLAREDEKHSGRGVKGNGRNASAGGESSSSLPHGLVKANSLGSGAFNRLRSSTGAPANASPLAPQFGITRSKSDAVALRRENSLGSAFASLGEPPFPHHGQNNSSSSDRAKTSAAAAAAAAAAAGPAPRPELTVARGASGAEEEGPSGRGSSEAQSTSTAEESVRRTQQQPQPQQPTGVWRQGSVPSFEGMGGHEASSLRPGVAPGVHFGGTGSPPDLPWVTCNGTISGVLYRVEKGQVRIVCACHGRHMTPAEFVQHAGCGEIPNPEKAIVVGPFTVLAQQPASAQA